MKALYASAMGAAGLAAYALYEPFRFRVGVVELPVRRSCPPLDVLHVSDFHLGSPHTRWTAEALNFLSTLPDVLREPVDIVAATGDFIENNVGIEPAVSALNRLPARLGRFFVLGSHDYYVPRFTSYAKYFTGKRPVDAPRADTRRLVEGLAAEGWVDLTNATSGVSTSEGDVRLVGVDDPYLERQETAHIRRAPEDVAGIGLMHSPDLVSEFALEGFDLMLAGHTHAGQVRLPGLGALVTNCSLPAELAGGAHRVGGSWLHVSPGLGTGRFSPIRFLCRPEVTLLKLRPTG